MKTSNSTRFTAAATVLLICALRLGGETHIYYTEDPKTFVKIVGERFESKITTSQMDDIKIALGKNDVIAATDLVHQYARTTDTRSSVAISSTKGGGATVRYQTVGQRKRNEPPTTAKSPTALTEKMYLGRYHIWSERAGVATSDKNSQFDILSSSEKVNLTEE